jgi:hypothetical protein
MRRQIGTVLTAGLLTWAVALAPGMASAANTYGAPPPTPQIGGSATSGTDGTIEQVRQIVQCGTTMYAVGTFTQVRNANSSTPVNVGNAIAFSPNSKGVYQLTAWNPNVNGTVNTVACAPDGDIYLGGNFTQVGTTAVRNLAKVDPTTGAVNTAFLWNLNPNNTNSPSGQVNHVEVVQGHLLVGGNFPSTKISATKSTPGYLASVNPLTGRDDGYITQAAMAISGTYVYPNVRTNTTKIFNMSVHQFPTGDSAVLMMGVFLSVGGQHHEQMFRLNMPLNATAPTVSAWQPEDLFVHCSTVEPFYAQDAAWSPDGQTIYIANTGFKPFNQPRGNSPRIGPCDSALAYPAEPEQLIPAKVRDFTQLPGTPNSLWTNYTGCDSLYSIAADANTVFVAGHERFIDNPNECDQNSSPPGRNQAGLGEIDPSTGLSQIGPNRGRGLGADDLLRTSTGLWIASDNQANTATCAGKSARMGICFIPITG